MPNQPPSRNNRVGSLLILGCSGRKLSNRGKIPAIELYDGVNFRVLSSFLNQNGWPPGLTIKILSAKYGLIDATDLIETYDERMSPDAAHQSNLRTLRQLAKAGDFSKVFVNLGNDYLPAIKGIDDLFPKARIVYPAGGIGLKMAQMKKWLLKLPGRTATLPGQRSRRSYLYFFPDWDDYVLEPFVHENAGEAEVAQEKKYAHEIFGESETPYDGMLVSLAQMYTGKGTLSRLDSEVGSRTELRRLMKVPNRLLMFGDCGAFSYVNDEVPPFSPERAAQLYDRFGFTIGASVDHIPIPEIEVESPNGKKVKRQLSIGERRARMRLTILNARKFIAACRQHSYSFIPLGVIQGLDTASYVKCVHEYIDMGYKHIALGGLVPRSDSDILEICSAVRAAIQVRTRGEKQNIWLHLFGILRPKIQSSFRALGVSSFDSASYLRKAWLRSDQNYIAADGNRWYSTIRIPISSSKRLREAAESNGISDERLQTMEQRCLDALLSFDGTTPTHDEVVESVNDYGPLLERRGEDNHFFEKHNAVLDDRPWEKCPCAVCRSMGIEVVVFRGTGRNKRRGFHNTWVLYHKILHGK